VNSKQDGFATFHVARVTQFGHSEFVVWALLLEGGRDKQFGCFGSFFFETHVLTGFKGVLFQVQ
jgi:hypothetical protein